MATTTPFRGEELEITGGGDSLSFTHNPAIAGTVVAQGRLADIGRKLARTSDGLLHAVYIRSDGIFNQVYYSYSADNGQIWVEEQITVALRNHSYPVIATDGNNFIRLVWVYCQEPSGPGKTCTVQYRLKTVGWQPIEDVLTGYLYAPAIAVDSQDNVHLVVRGYNPGAWNCNYSRYKKRTALGWGPTEQVSSICWATQPAIAVDQNDNIHIAYGHSPGAYYNLMYRKRTPSSWEPEQEFEARDSNGDSPSASLAVDNNNFLHLAWQWKQPGVTQYAIKYRQFTAAWQPIENLTGTIGYSQIAPTIAADSQNNLHLLWPGRHSGSSAQYQIRHLAYINFWQPIGNLTSGLIDQSSPALIFASWPRINAIRSNIPQAGYAFVWNDGSMIKFYKSTDLAWGTPILNVPLFLQTDPRWAGDRYDFTTPTINALGCALSSAAMALKFHDVATTPDGTQATNPGTLNQWLIDIKDYKMGTPSEGNLDWTKLPAYSNNKIALRPSYNVGTSTPESFLRQLIDSDLANGDPVIVKTKYFNTQTSTTTEHFVVAKGKSGSTYAINDPRSFVITTLDQGSYPILGVRRFTKGDGTPVSLLSVSVASPVQILVTDPSGKKTGFDPTVGETIFGIPNSGYAEDHIDSDSDEPVQTGFVKTLDIIQPEDGNYRIELIGEGLGVYTLAVMAVDNDGAFHEIKTSGVTDSGITSSFDTSFSATATEAPPLIKEVSFASIHRDIEIALQLGIIDNQGIANSLLQKLDAAEMNVKKGKSQTARNILNALRQEAEAQKGKRINEPFASALLQDIDALLHSLVVLIVPRAHSLFANIYDILSVLVFRLSAFLPKP